MQKFFLTITNEQRDELKDHFIKNGYSVTWESDDVISVDDEETSYIATILYDHYIPFTDDENEQWFGSREMKKKIDTIYNLAREVLDMSEDIGEYSFEESEILDELANIVSVYNNYL